MTEIKETYVQIENARRLILRDKIVEMMIETMGDLFKEPPMSEAMANLYKKRLAQLVDELKENNV